MSALFFRILQHLLPHGRAWRAVVDKALRRLFAGLSGAPDEARAFVDGVYDDLLPQRTRALAEWEAQFGLTAGALTEQARRDRLDAAWKATGGQGPDYIESTLRGAGFDVTVHEWWVPGSDGPNPPKRDALYALGALSFIQCGTPLAQCGEPEALCGNVLVEDGYLLTNRGLGEYTPPPIPVDSAQWPYILYIGGETFPAPADVPAARRREFEALALQIAPAHLWLGMIINYV